MITRSRDSIGCGGRSVAPVHSQVDRDVQDPRAFGKIHPQEEDVGPSAVREVQPHRRPLDQDRKQRPVRLAQQEPRMDPQRMFFGTADPKHPAVSLAASHRPAHLVGQRLKRDLLVGPRQRAGDVPFGPSRSITARKAAIACS